MSAGVFDRDFLLDVAMGFRRGYSVLHKFGRNKAVGTTFVPVCLGGIYRTPQATGATTLRIKAGGDVADTADGAGAREVTLIGLDENFAEQTVTLATAGVAASASTTVTFTRLFRAYVSASGVYASQILGSHVGEIVIENTAGTEDWITIDVADFPKGQTECGVYSVPPGFTAYVLRSSVFIDSSKLTQTLLFRREGIQETAAPYQAMRILANLQQRDNHHETTHVAPIPIRAPADIGFLARVASGTSEINVDFEVLLVEDSAP